jgi:hypothetical protein
MVAFAGNSGRVRAGGWLGLLLWLVWSTGVRLCAVAGEDGGGLPVTPGHLWDRSPLGSLVAGT